MILYWFALVHLPSSVEALKFVAILVGVLLTLEVFAEGDVLGGLFFTCLAALIVAAVYYSTILVGYTSVDTHFVWNVDGVFGIIWLIWVGLHIRGYLVYEAMMPKKRPEFCLRIDDLGDLGGRRHAITVSVISLAAYMLTLELPGFLVLAIFLISVGLLVKSLVGVSLDAKKQV